MNLFKRNIFHKPIGLQMQWELKKPEKPGPKATKKQLREYAAKLDKWHEGKAEALEKQRNETRRQEADRRREENERANRIEYEAPGVGRRWVNDGRGGYYEYSRHDEYDGGR